LRGVQIVQAVGKRMQLRLGAGQRVVDREHTRHDPLHIAVHHHGAAAEGDGGDRRGGIGADAGQFQEFRLRIGIAAARRRQLPRAAMQVARPRVVSQPLPGVQNLIQIGRRKVRDGRPASQEGFEIRHNGGHRGLLQHDLGKPYVIWIGPRSRRGAPRQKAAVPVVPGKQGPGGRGLAQSGHRGVTKVQDIIAAGQHDRRRDTRERQ
jgi:hypothetical protein